MNGEKVTIEVDGRQLEAPRGSMLIEVMDEAGVQVPRFCYHKKLSVAANCRMCLVDVERAPKPLPACATPVTDGMKVFTRSERAQAAQRDVMAFLLINHPLDCPICDQGGECELQDNSVGFGGSRSEYAEIKRVVVDKDIGPLIETEMTRCIQCTRCVRFGEEIAGMRELGAIGRGENMEIGTYVARTVVSELSGNVIDLCPVGALTAKPSRYKARAWEMFAHDSIAPHDSVGSHIAVHTFDGKVIRVVPRSNEAVNECWISDRDRFSYQGLASPERLTAPQLRQEDGSWRAVDWETALTAVAAVLRQTDPERIGALAAPEATLEELYLFQKLMRGLGVSHIDHRLQQLDFSDQEQVSTAPTLGCSIPELEQQQAVLLIGANSRQDQPLLNHRLRKASLKGARVMAVNPYRVAYNFEVLQCAVAPADMVTELAAIAQAASEVCGQPLPDAVVALCAGLTVSEAARQMARSLCEAEKAMVLMGNLAMQHADMADLRALSSVIATLTGGTCGYLPASANSVGAWLAGVLPHRAAAGQAAAMKGRDAVAMLQEALPVYVLLHAEAEDFNNPLLAGQAFAAAEQVIAITPFAGAGLREQASILLPAGAFTETSGTFVNAEGQWQSFQGATAPPGQARPGWKILRVLGNRLELPEFDYVNAREVLAELRLELQGTRPDNSYHIGREPERRAPEGSWQRIGEVHMYRHDGLVRRAPALQALVPPAVVRMHPQDMAGLGLADGDRVEVRQQAVLTLVVRADEGIPRACVYIMGGLDATHALGGLSGGLELSPVTGEVEA